MSSALKTIASQFFVAYAVELLLVPVNPRLHFIQFTRTVGGRVEDALRGGLAHQKSSAGVAVRESVGSLQTSTGLELHILTTRLHDELWSSLRV